MIYFIIETAFSLLCVVPEHRIESTVFGIRKSIYVGLLFAYFLNAVYSWSLKELRYKRFRYRKKNLTGKIFLVLSILPLYANLHLLLI
jgi:hypothetical protein